MRNPNGYGHITKLAGNRRKPYAVRKIVGWSEKGTPRYKYVSYHKTRREAERALKNYNEDTIWTKRRSRNYIKNGMRYRSVKKLRGHCAVTGSDSTISSHCMT